MQTGNKVSIYSSQLTGGTYKTGGRYGNKVFVKSLFGEVYTESKVYKTLEDLLEQPDVYFVRHEEVGESVLRGDLQ